MRDIDMTIYNATRNRPDGPLIVDDVSGGNYSVEPFRNAEGNVTPGGWIGYFIGYAIIAGGVLYCAWFL